MTKHLSQLLDTVLASTARTVRAVVLIVTIGAVTGSVPGISLPLRESPAASALAPENTQSGSAILDFGKLVDIGGLADDGARAAFFAGYQRHAAPAWPWPAEFPSVQLWVTAGVLVYSLALGLRDFAAHGYRRLAELETCHCRESHT